MGLDMYLYRITRISTTEQRKLRGKTEKEIYDSGYSLFYRPRNKDDERLIKYIKPYLRGIKISQEYFDMEKIRQDFKIPKTYLQCGSSYAGNGDVSLTFTSRDCQDSKKASFNTNKNPEYILTKLTNCYVCKEREIGYWRKNYDLQEELYREASYGGVEIENCGYYPLNDGMTRAILRDKWEYSDKVQREDLWDDNNSIVCYHEWY